MGRKATNAPWHKGNLSYNYTEKATNIKKKSELLKMKANAVFDIVRRFRNKGRVASIKQKGRPKNLTIREEHDILKQVRTNIGLADTLIPSSFL